MKIEQFAKKATEQTPNNTFGRYEGQLSNVPKELQNYYKSYNPKKVEIGYNGTSLYFIPAEDLAKENCYYKDLGIGFVFATCDGDPIFYWEGKIYTCPHGVKSPQWECLSDTFEGFLDNIIVD